MTRQLLTLSLALLLTGLVACNKDAGDVAAPDDPAQAGAETTAGAPEDGQAAAPGQPGAAAPSATPSKPLDPSQIPAVVARVNGVEIKKDELVKTAEQMRFQFAQTNRGQMPPLNESFYKQILEGMVAQILLLEEAKRQGVTVSDAELNPQMAQIRGGFPNQAEFDKALSQQGLTEKELREKMRNEAVIQKFVTTKVFNEVSVTDQAAREFYDKNTDRMQRPERAHLRHILIGVQQNAAAADKEKAKEKAEDLLGQLKDGGDFAKLAAENSDDPGSKMRGGDLSWVSRGQTVPPFEKAAFALTKPNALSDVVETQFGYHIIQLVEREAGSTVPFEEARPQITQMLRQRRAGERLEARVEDLKKKGKVEVFL
ncbi:MAG TPA: peptidylprolyl isomerase [Thermoanaerobaculia bacterium]|nr:peptidylprolyl isomerase [Thermoanaerobaculia bacterium]